MNAAALAGADPTRRHERRRGRGSAHLAHEGWADDARGNSLTADAPADQATRISVGVMAPGRMGTPWSNGPADRLRVDVRRDEERRAGRHGLRRPNGDPARCRLPRRRSPSSASRTGPRSTPMHPVSSASPRRRGCRRRSLPPNEGWRRVDGSWPRRIAIARPSQISGGSRGVPSITDPPAERQAGHANIQHEQGSALVVRVVDLRAGARDEEAIEPRAAEGTARRTGGRDRHGTVETAIRRVRGAPPGRPRRRPRDGPRHRWRAHRAGRRARPRRQTPNRARAHRSRHRRDAEDLPQA